MAGDRDEMGWTDYKGTIITGQNLVRGTVLGVITASGKYTKSLSASSDGSQIPAAILLHDVDATSADTEAMVRKTGIFNAAALTLGASHTIASIRAGLEDRSIFIRP
jgi:hypothetical protein